MYATIGESVREPGTIGVVGLGYVGLPTALAIVEAGASVVGIDVSAARLADIRAHRVDLIESDRCRLGRFIDTERLSFSDDVTRLRDADSIIICVPTPVDGHLVPDTTALSAACNSVVGVARPGQTIILTSTSYVGCTRELLVEPLRRRGFIPGSDIFVAFSPERIDPGSPSHLPKRTPRVLGGVTTACTARAERTLAKSAPWVHVVSSPESAELTKLLENTFRAVNIGLANEFATIAGELGVDIMEVIAAAATKPYGFMPFHPGPGVGGHCIPCDPHYLLWQLRANRIPTPITEAAMAAIAARPRAVVLRAQELLAESGRPLASSRILVVGIAYKPGVADVRESPALQIIDELQDHGALVSFTDAMVESVITLAGPLKSEADPARDEWDLVIAHTLHPEVDHSWLSSHSLVLDATYRLSDAVGRHTL
ncbi:nucleotide sugar dehydrogenase [Mycolicibacterium chubuense]|nr:nucleotide sugar dehydrogenase [Mycolicibacterium chubuense]